MAGVYHGPDICSTVATEQGRELDEVDYLGGVDWAVDLVACVKVIKGDIWDLQADRFIGITTNGFVKENGEAVMGRGIAWQAKLRYPTLPARLGRMINKAGNRVMLFNRERIFSFPVKDNWWDPADLGLIERSARDLRHLIDTDRLPKGEIELLLVRPGCGNGKLKWKDVESVIDPHLDGLVTIVEWEMP
jgi:hypothetical protein